MKISKLLGELLKEKKLIKDEQLNQALERQRIKNGRIGINLMELGYINDKALLDTLSEQLGIDSVSLKEIDIDKSTLEKVPKNVVSKYKIIPIKFAKYILTIAMATPTDVWILQGIERELRYEVEPILALETDIEEAIERYYGGK